MKTAALDPQRALRREAVIVRGRLAAARAERRRRRILQARRSC